MEIEKNLEKSLTWSSVGDLHPKKEFRRFDSQTQVQARPTGIRDKVILKHSSHLTTLKKKSKEKGFSKNESYKSEDPQRKKETYPKFLKEKLTVAVLATPWSKKEPPLLVVKEKIVFKYKKYKKYFIIYISTIKILFYIPCPKLTAAVLPTHGSK